VTDLTATATQLITVDELPESVRQAVTDYGERHGVPGLLTATTMAARTVSPDGRRRRFWRSKEPVSSYALLSAASLVVVTTVPEPIVTGWRLTAGEARRVTESVNDMSVTGLHVTAMRFGAAVRETMLVQLASDDEGAAFEAALLVAMST
jgi:hypothetical protein